MNKPAALRDYLCRCISHLATDPQQLKIFVERGNIVGRSGESLSFEYRFTLRLFFQDFTGSLDQLAVPVLAWLATNQPDVLQSKEKSAKCVRFEAEPLSNDKTDIVIEIDLTESVIVTEDTDDAGHRRLTVTHKGEVIHPGPYATGDYGQHTGAKIGAEWHLVQIDGHG